MTTRFYLLPLEQVGNQRGPKYLKWAANEAGLDVRWSLKDFGAGVQVGLVAAEADLSGDLFAFPADLKSELGQAEHDQLTGYLRAAGVQTNWLKAADSYRQALHKVAGLTQAMQAGRDEAGLWLARPVLFGFAKLGAIGIDPLQAEWRSYLPPFALALPATDAFTTAVNQSLTIYSANWTLNSGDFEVQDSTDDCLPASPNTECGAHWNADVFNNDQYAQGVITALDTIGSVKIGVSVRAHASAATYYGYYSDGTAAPARWLFKMVTGVWTQLGSTGAALSVNDVIRLEASGTTLTPKINGSTDPTIGAQTDSAIASGSAGLSGYNSNNTSRIDNWEGGNLAAGGLSIPVAMHHRRQQEMS